MHAKSTDLLSDDSENEHNHSHGKLGVWIRRRRVDGALNRIPVDFYPKLWKIFEKVKCKHANFYFKTTLKLVFSQVRVKVTKLMKGFRRKQISML